MISPVVTMKTLEWFTGIALDVIFVIVFNYQKYYHKFLCLNKNVINAIIFNNSYKYIKMVKYSYYHGKTPRCGGLSQFEISSDIDLDDPSTLATSKAVYTLNKKIDSITAANSNLPLGSIIIYSGKFGGHENRFPLDKVTNEPIYEWVLCDGGGGQRNKNTRFTRTNDNWIFRRISNRYIWW